MPRPNTPPLPVPQGFGSGDGSAPFAVSGKRLHLLGIGGCGMSGLARVLAGRGAIVDGADQTPSSVTDTLARDGFRVTTGPAGPVPEGVDLVIASAAIKPDHPAWMDAETRGIPILTYAEALGCSMLGRTGVAIAGTHGKSTTSAMLGSCLVDCGLDPSVIVGATCAQLVNGNLAEPTTTPAGHRAGAPKIPLGPMKGEPGVLLAEACEFNRSFHNLRPTLAAIGSVEADHLDIYGSLDAVVSAFRDFAALLPASDEGGFLLINHDGAHRREVTAQARCAVQTIGYSPGADWRVSHDPQTGRVTLTSQELDTPLEWVCRLPGEHNAFNSAVAATLALRLGGAPETIARSLGAFRGLDRRTQFLGEFTLPGAPQGSSPIRVYDDYGHHPTEIDATLRALRQRERPEERGGRLVCVFQPHQHSRTRFLLDEFAQSFNDADVVIVPHIYFVRDSEIEKTKVAAGDLVDRLRTRGVRALHLYPFEAIIEYLENAARPGDLVVVMGAGPVWQVAHGLIDSLGGEPRAIVQTGPAGEGSRS